ncbi:MAG: enoyl-CoA hydratase, partial [Planctomycetota bacterium]
AGAQDLLLSGRVVSATAAETLGLVNPRVTPDALTATVEAYGAELRAAGPLATAGLLATLRPQPTTLQQALEREASQQAKDYASLDFQEGIAAALAGRRAEFGP